MLGSRWMVRSANDDLGGYRSREKSGESAVNGREIEPWRKSIRAARASASGAADGSPHAELVRSGNELQRWSARSWSARSIAASEEGNEAQAIAEFYKPWYAGKFADITAVSAYWTHNYTRLREESASFTDSFYGTSMPDVLVEAVAANLSILKSPTVLRQTDGRLWGWEGSLDKGGSCPGTCTHVWNYAQALAHLFPELERGIRNTEFTEGQDEHGHQNFRVPLPIQPADHDFHAASDGQLGGLMKVYREWKISGNTEWLREIWPKVKLSLQYCMETWIRRSGRSH